MSAAPAIDLTKKRAANEEPWPEPEPFDAMNLPEFPVDDLASWQREWATAEAEFTQTPLALPACVALGVTSLAVMRMYHVRVRDGWEEPTNLYIVIAAKPGERKSAVFADGSKPVQAHMLREAERLAPQIRDREIEREILIGKIDAAKSAAIKDKPYEGGSAKQAAAELMAELDGLPELVAPTLLVDDCTPEALAVIMSRNAERIGQFSAEAGPLEMLNGRYSDKGGNFELHLKAHPGDYHRADRIKRPPIHLVHPLLSLVLTVQPHVISGLASKDGFRGRGLLARFLFALPQTALGRREVDSQPVPEGVRHAYSDAIRALLRSGPSDRTIIMSAAADRARSALQAELEPRLGPDGDLAPIGDWANKLVGAVCRIAGVLHVADFARDVVPTPEEIPAETFARAARIGEYFLEHARAAFDSMGADEETELAKRVWAWVQRNGLLEFSERDARRAVHARGDVSAVLAKLVERHLVRERAAAKTGGRPTVVFDVNPRALT